MLSLLKRSINRVETPAGPALPSWTEAGIECPCQPWVPRPRVQPCSHTCTCSAKVAGRRGGAGCLCQAGLTHSSFLLLWSAVLIMYPTSLAVISMTFSNYVLQPVFPNCIPPAAASRALSMACLSERPPWGHTMPPAPVWEDCGGVGGVPPTSSPL